MLANDQDYDSSDVTAVLVEGPQYADSFILNADGSFDYTPGVDFVYSDSFTYKADDGEADSNVATVTITLDVPVIEVGEHSLMANTFGQTIEVPVTGGQAVAGLNLFAQVGDGGPELVGYGLPPGTDGPAITAVDLKTGTIFAGIPDPQVDQPGIPQVVSSSIAISAPGGTVAAEGRLATLTIDTTGFSSGTWNLLLKDVLPGLGPFETDFAPTQATIINGSIIIVPEPATAVMVLVLLAGLLCWRWPRASRA